MLQIKLKQSYCYEIEMIYALLPLVFHYYSILTALIFHYYNIKLSSTTSFLVYLLFSCCCLDYWWCQSRSFNPAQSFYLHHIHFVTYIFYFHPLDSFCIQQNSGSYACKLKESYYLWPQRSSEANMRPQINSGVLWILKPSSRQELLIRALFS